MSAISSQVTLTTASVAYSLGSTTYNDIVIIKALPTNTGVVYIGNDGNDTVSSTTGFPLSAGDTVVLSAGSLSKVYATSTVNGDKVAVLDGSV
jgi:hypothetical protein